MKTIEERTKEIAQEVRLLCSGNIKETIMVPIEMCFQWDEGLKGYVVDELDDDRLINRLSEDYVEKAAAEFKEKCNKRIKKVVQKSNALAKELGIDPIEFFHQFC